ncbi:hypothetical protein K7W42_13075 [Deinococcus sp. HMF7604]|uniref:hypothetical protein n=1 Tax=Deinococcus betulae TaxID=2873312 RepID=UPI001CCD9B1D|nr:hypothetical protein [Deinococcus betulae]MBZ9751790.1 hypothetical protein [Deinococcus betulae]
MATTFHCRPRLLCPDLAEAYGLLNDQCLNRQVHGVPGAYSGPLQGAVVSRPGEAGVPLPDGPVTGAALRQLLASGQDVLLVRGDVDLVSGGIQVRDIALVIGDDQRWWDATARQDAADAGVLARIRHLTAQVTAVGAW